MALPGLDVEGGGGAGWGHVGAGCVGTGRPRQWGVIRYGQRRAEAGTGRRPQRTRRTAGVAFVKLDSSTPASGSIFVPFQNILRNICTLEN